MYMYKFDKVQSDFVDEEIYSLLEKGVIVERSNWDDCFVSNVFLRPKPNNKFRMILDLSELNEFVTHHHFKMEHLEVAERMLFQGAWLGSIDLREAYYAIPIREEDRKYLCFQWEGKLFQFTCIPFGLSSAPWIFTKTLKPIFAKFHEMGFQGFGYIDDSFVFAESREQCQEALKCLTQLFSSLGFRVHDEKSVLEPTRELTFLGYVLNSTDMSVAPTKDDPPQPSLFYISFIKCKK